MYHKRVYKQCLVANIFHLPAEIFVRLQFAMFTLFTGVARLRRNAKATQLALALAWRTGDYQIALRTLQYDWHLIVARTWDNQEHKQP